MEINRKGAVVAEFPTGGRAFSSLELKDGNILLPCGDGHFFQVIDRKTGKELRRVTSDDVQGASLLFVGQIIGCRQRKLADLERVWTYERCYSRRTSTH